MFALGFQYREQLFTLTPLSKTFFFSYIQIYRPDAKKKKLKSQRKKKEHKTKQEKEAPRGPLCAMNPTAAGATSDGEYA